jgi:glycosyltransferase involved in cell wall biosynthesis
MKVLHIISSGGMYGAEAVILTMSRTLNQGPHHSVLGVFSNLAQPNLQLYDIATKEGIETHLIPCQGQIDRTVPAAIRELADRTGSTVVHAHGYKADIYVYLAMRGSQIPVVSTCHTWYDNDLTVRLYGTLDRFILRSYSGVVAVSEEVKQRLLDAGVRADRIRLIRNGIDLRPFAHSQPAPQNKSQNQLHTDRPLKVGLVGRLAPEKGVDLFLRAAAGVLSELPLTQFVVVGDGPDQAKLQALIEELGIGHNALLLGREEDMPAFYASLDLMVSSSRQEGLPMALLEGMASGLPLIATAVGAVPTVVQNGRTGLLVPPENLKELTAAILSLLQDPASRKAYGAAAREVIAEQYSAERMTDDYLQLYEQAAQTTHTKASQ